MKRRKLKHFSGNTTYTTIQAAKQCLDRIIRFEVGDSTKYVQHYIKDLFPEEVHNKDLVIEIERQYRKLLSKI